MMLSKQRRYSARLVGPLEAGGDTAVLVSLPDKIIKRRRIYDKDPSLENGNEVGKRGVENFLQEVELMVESKEEEGDKNIDVEKIEEKGIEEVENNKKEIEEEDQILGGVEMSEEKKEETEKKEEEEENLGKNDDNNMKSNLNNNDNFEEGEGEENDVLDEEMEEACRNEIRERINLINELRAMLTDPEALEAEEVSFNPKQTKGGRMATNFSKTQTFKKVSKKERKELRKKYTFCGLLRVVIPAVIRSIENENSLNVLKKVKIILDDLKNKDKLLISDNGYVIIDNVFQIASTEEEEEGKRSFFTLKLNKHNNIKVTIPNGQGDPKNKNNKNRLSFPLQEMLNSGNSTDINAVELINAVFELQLKDVGDAVLALQMLCPQIYFNSPLILLTLINKLFRQSCHADFKYYFGIEGKDYPSEFVYSDTNLPVSCQFALFEQTSLWFVDSNGNRIQEFINKGSLIVWTGNTLHGGAAGPTKPDDFEYPLNLELSKQYGHMHPRLFLYGDTATCKHILAQSQIFLDNAHQAEWFKDNKAKVCMFREEKGEKFFMGKP